MVSFSFSFSVCAACFFSSVLSRQLQLLRLLGAVILQLYPFYYPWFTRAIVTVVLCGVAFVWLFICERELEIGFVCLFVRMFGNSEFECAV